MEPKADISEENYRELEKSEPHFLKKLNIAVRIRRLFYVSYSARYIRFQGDLDTYINHLDQLEVKDGEKMDWIKRAKVLCQKAKEKLFEIRIDEGWKLLHEAQRLEVYSGDEFKKAQIVQLREEAGKLNKWRSDAIFRIIGYKDDDNKIGTVTSQELEVALRIRDEYYHSVYYTNRLTRIQFNGLFLVLVILIALIFRYVYVADLTVYSDMKDLNCCNLWGILLFGLLGATTSTIFHLRNTQGSARIPEIISNNAITFSRIFVGAGFSIFLFILMNSEIAESVDIFEIELKGMYEFFSIAFISGFSERLALNSIQKVVGKKEG